MGLIDRILVIIFIFLSTVSLLLSWTAMDRIEQVKKQQVSQLDLIHSMQGKVDRAMGNNVETIRTIRKMFSGKIFIPVDRIKEISDNSSGNRRIFIAVKGDESEKWKSGRPDKPDTGDPSKE